MGDYDSLEIQGAERDNVLQAIQEQIRPWGLSMPAGELIPFHFG